MQSILSSEGDTCPVSLPTLPWCCYLFLHWFGWVLLKYDGYMHESTCPDNDLTYFPFLELRLVPVWLFFWASVWSSFVVSGHKPSHSI
jgi:hypothetical protein